MFGNGVGTNGAGGAVDREEVAFAVGLAGDGDGLLVVIHLQGGGAADADLAHLAGDEGGVRGHPAAGGEDALGGDHAAEILGGGLDADEQDFLALLGGDDRGFRVLHLLDRRLRLRTERTIGRARVEAGLTKRVLQPTNRITTRTNRESAHALLSQPLGKLRTC